MKTGIVAIVLSLSALFAGCGGKQANESALISANGGSLVYFGPLEVGNGQLKSADGGLPKAGETITLATDIYGLSNRVSCSSYPNDWSRCGALEPRLYVRYADSQAFQEIAGLPKGFITRGQDTQFRGDNMEYIDTLNVPLQIPNNASRIEVYMVFNRYSFTASNCSVPYDVWECDITNQTFRDLGYVSNYGRNFAIGVRH